jgi:sarcosine oxidase
MVAGSLEACRLHRLDHELLDAEEVNRRIPAMNLPAGYGAIWQPEGGILHADRANAAHLRLAETAGAAVLTGTRVRAIIPASEAVEISLDGEMIRAGSVVVTAGPWIGDLVPELQPHLTVQRQVLCWFRPKEPSLFEPGALPVFAIESDDDIVYGFPDFAGTGFKCASHLGSGILAHADAASQDAGPADETRTRRFLERFAPAGAGALIGMKTCLYTMTPDEDFVIDLSPADPRIVVASPCSGHGYKFASVVGEVLADLATERATRHDISRFRIGRFRG